MTRIFLMPVAALALCAMSGLLQAEETPAPTEPGLMERGLQLFLEGLTKELVPEIEEGWVEGLSDLQGLMDEIGPSLQSFLAEMGPALAEIADQVQDWSVYELPEILPNGDIILRRKTPLSPSDPLPGTVAPDADGAIEI